MPQISSQNPSQKYYSPSNLSMKYSYFLSIHEPISLHPHHLYTPPATKSFQINSTSLKSSLNYLNFSPNSILHIQETHPIKYSKYSKYSKIKPTTTKPNPYIMYYRNHHSIKTNSIIIMEIIKYYYNSFNESPLLLNKNQAKIKFLDIKNLIALAMDLFNSNRPN
jgi:hypothetical protein